MVPQGDLVVPPFTFRTPSKPELRVIWRAFNCTSKARCFLSPQVCVGRRSHLVSCPAWMNLARQFAQNLALRPGDLTENQQLELLVTKSRILLGSVRRPESNLLM